MSGLRRCCGSFKQSTPAYPEPYVMNYQVSDFAREAGDREAIRQCLYRYSRGVDRCDPTLVRSAFWRDGIADFSGFVGDVEQLIAWAWPILQSMDQTLHSLSNILIQITGERAHVESYLLAYHRLCRAEGGNADLIVGARYIDTMERRDGEWRILKRIVVQEWYRQFSDSDEWGAKMFGGAYRLGSRDSSDPSYEVFERG
jgi:alpha-amylase/alpha-mannosidase (GH57 family)